MKPSQADPTVQAFDESNVVVVPRESAIDAPFAALHRRENTASLIAQAYRLLGIPDSQVREFDLEVPNAAQGPNPFHGSTVRLAGYVADWQWLYGRASGLK